MAGDLKIASAQFENASRDKSYNLAKIKKMAHDAAGRGCQVAAFHECSITGYSFARHTSRDELLAIAEPVPTGPSVQMLMDISRETRTLILASLFEREEDQETGDTKIYNTYICVDGTRLLGRFRKLHPFISKHLSVGNEYVVLDILGWKCGILICYGNNIVENVRATALLGAEIIIMLHVAMCTVSTRPGVGFVDPALWKNRERIRHR